MTKLLAISAAVLLAVSSAAWAGCAGHSMKTVSTAPVQTEKPATTVQTASAETK